MRVGEGGELGGGRGGVQCSGSGAEGAVHAVGHQGRPLAPGYILKRAIEERRASVCGSGAERE